MMKQQVNLYAFLPQKEHIQFTFKKFLILSGVFLLLILLDYEYAIWQKHKASVELQRVVKQIETEKANISHILAEYPPLSSADLDAFVKQLNQQLLLRTRLQTMLVKGTLFSAYLKALSEAIVAKVWLTEIHFLRLDQEIVLRGETLDIMAAQEFLDQLKKQSVFTREGFILEKISHTTSQSTLHFEIESHGVLL